MSFHVPERYRQPMIVRGENVSTPAYGNNGFFVLPPGRGRAYPLRIIASDGANWEKVMPLPAWEHVSVSTAVRCPTWPELCAVKALFWDPEDLVVQFHPRASDYVDEHPYCLHLWRPLGIEIPTPPPITVGHTRKS